MAEAGRGAKTPEDCTGEGEQTTCIGPTGSITEIFRPHRTEPLVERVVEACLRWPAPTARSRPAPTAPTT